MCNSVKNKIISRIYGHGRGWVFSANDFLRDFKRYEIDMALKSLTDAGKIRRICRGIYDYPAFSAILQIPVGPDMNMVAFAIARKFKWQIYPSGDTALNYFGLSTQIPGRLIYISSGPGRIFTTEFGSIEFKNSTQRESQFRYIESALVVQAVRSLGVNLITDDILERLSAAFDADMWQKIKQDSISAAGWIYAVICKLCEMKGDK
ncbi:MAG: hypothetical protein IKD09_02720 [Lentisphaeria bacterium]|nr:hypothetical protein [Lentisphaeria bacterium]